ncbi:MAG: lipocalin family protein [Spirochaetaceae bacterium]|nr:lipocalin family protein [Spirochaetaceae bacterium]
MKSKIWFLLFFVAANSYANNSPFANSIFAATHPWGYEPSNFLIFSDDGTAEHRVTIGGINGHIADSALFTYSIDGNMLTLTPINSGWVRNFRISNDGNTLDFITTSGELSYDPPYIRQ